MEIMGGGGSGSGGGSGWWQGAWTWKNFFFNCFSIFNYFLTSYNFNYLLFFFFFSFVVVGLIVKIFFKCVLK